jgi:hypothetical protein
MERAVVVLIHRVGSRAPVRVNIPELAAVATREGDKGGGVMSSYQSNRCDFPTHTSVGVEREKKNMQQKKKKKKEEEERERKREREREREREPYLSTRGAPHSKAR